MLDRHVWLAPKYDHSSFWNFESFQTSCARWTGRVDASSTRSSVLHSQLISIKSVDNCSQANKSRCTGGPKRQNNSLSFTRKNESGKGRCSRAVAIKLSLPKKKNVNSFIDVVKAKFVGLIKKKVIADAFVRMILTPASKQIAIKQNGFFHLHDK